MLAPVPTSGGTTKWGRHFWTTWNCHRSSSDLVWPPRELADVLSEGGRLRPSLVLICSLSNVSYVACPEFSTADGHILCFTRVIWYDKGDEMTLAVRRARGCWLALLPSPQTTRFAQSKITLGSVRAASHTPGETSGKHSVSLMPGEA